MPCDSGGYDYSREYKREVDTLTNMLCWLLTAWYAPERPAALRKDIDAWWEEHQELDRKKAAAEDAERQRRMQRDMVLNKLSAEERRLLGIER